MKTIRERIDESAHLMPVSLINEFREVETLRYKQGADRMLSLILETLRTEYKDGWSHIVADWIEKKAGE